MSRMKEAHRPDCRTVKAIGGKFWEIFGSGRMNIHSHLCSGRWFQTRKKVPGLKPWIGFTYLSFFAFAGNVEYFAPAFQKKHGTY